MGLGKGKVNTNIFLFLKLADRHMGVVGIVYMYAVNIFYARSIAFKTKVQGPQWLGHIITVNVY